MIPSKGVYMQSPEEINDEIQRRIDETRRANAEASHKKAQEAILRQREHRVQQIQEGLASRSGIAIRALEGAATLESRRLMAGFIVSATSANIPKQKANHTTRSIGMPGLETPVNFMLRNVVKGWDIEIGQYKRHEDSEIGYRMLGIYATLTPEYRIHCTDSRFDGTFNQGVVRDSVIGYLAARHAEWIEPNPSTYE